MARAVLDASAILCLLNNEPGSDAVAAFVDEGIVSTVNYAEVIAKLVERGSTPGQAQSALRAVALAAVDFDLALAQRTGSLRSETIRRGLSLGDRACLALAERGRLPAITCDRSWLGAVSGIEVRLAR